MQYAGAPRKGNTVYFGVSTYARLGDPGDGRAVQRCRSTAITTTRSTSRRSRRGSRSGRTPTRRTSSSSRVGSPAAALGFTNVFNSNVNTAPYNNNVLVDPGTRRVARADGGDDVVQVPDQWLQPLLGHDRHDGLGDLQRRDARPDLLRRSRRHDDVSRARRPEDRRRLRRRRLHGQRVEGRACCCTTSTRVGSGPRCSRSRSRETAAGRGSDGSLLRPAPRRDGFHLKTQVQHHYDPRAWVGPPLGGRVQM